MGFFSKIWKGLKKTVKKIGKGIKSAFQKFGKFMGKIGILGQVAMFFIMPYVGAALGGMFTGAAGALATNTVGGALGAVGQAAGKVMQFVGNTVGKAGTVFSNITKGVTDTLGNFAKTASNNMFGTTFDAASNFFTGGDSAFSRSFGGDSRFQNLTTDFSKVTSSIDKTEAKLNTNSGQKAMDQTVAESSGSDRFGFDSDYAKGYDDLIAKGQTNLTASTDPTLVLDSAAFEPVSNIPSDSMLEGMEVTPDFKAPIIETPTVVQNPSLLGTTRDTGLAETLRNVDPTSAFTKAASQPDPSFFERLSTGISEIPETIYNKAGEIVDDPLGYATEGMEETFKSGVKTRIMQETGIQAKPEYNVQNVSNVAYVPSFESFGGSQQQYGAQEIMNARSFEQQVTNNPSPYGYTAFQYNNYMAQFSQTA